MLRAKVHAIKCRDGVHEEMPASFDQRLHRKGRHLVSDASAAAVGLHDLARVTAEHRLEPRFKYSQTPLIWQCGGLCDQL